MFGSYWAIGYHPMVIVEKIPTGQPSLRFFKVCAEQMCNWGTTVGNFSNDKITGTFDLFTVKRDVNLTLTQDNKLQVEALYTDLTDMNKFRPDLDLLTRTSGPPETNGPSTSNGPPYMIGLIVGVAAAAAIGVGAVVMLKKRSRTKDQSIP
jgi:hypothetical protein